MAAARMIDGNASSLGSAARWIEAVIQGPIMTSLAVLAIAAVGFAMLRGRLSVRRGATVVAGCFIAFGAPSIARSLTDLAYSRSVADASSAQNVEAPPPPSFEPPAKAPSQQMDDPYAGASVRN